ncbi:MAG: dCMP deaminase family protein [Flavobacteriaceae bacterium]|nr:dCMP deaminase family protein [Flavobacteriaceae bacterium]
MITKDRRYHIAYMKMAIEWSNLSHCHRKKVGALIVKDGMIISDGYNGCPSGIDNKCEDEQDNTYWYVLHAEANAILKVASSTQSCKGSILYITLSPCKECCKLIHQAGITTVVYKDKYRESSGLDFLKDAKVKTIHLKDE